MNINKIINFDTTNNSGVNNMKNDKSQIPASSSNGGDDGGNNSYVTHLELELALERVMRRFDEKIDQKFEKIDQKFEKIDQKFERIDQKFEKIDQKFEKVTNQLNTLENKINLIEQKNDTNGKFVTWSIGIVSSGIIITLLSGLIKFLFFE